MTVVSSVKDPVALTLVVVSQFDATPDEVWNVWEDARSFSAGGGCPRTPQRSAVMILWSTASPVITCLDRTAQPRLVANSIARRSRTVLNSTTDSRVMTVNQSPALNQCRAA